MYSEPESWAVHYLESQEVSRLDVVSYISHGVSKVGDGKFSGEGEPAEGDELGGAPKKEALESFCVNLNAEAEEGRIDPLVGRSKEVVARCMSWHAAGRTTRYCRGFRSGKTAIVEGMAWRMTRGGFPMR